MGGAFVGVEVDGAVVAAGVSDFLAGVLESEEGVADASGLLSAGLTGLLPSFFLASR